MSVNNSDTFARPSRSATIRSVWTLLFGIGLLMMANGVQAIRAVAHVQVFAAMSTDATVFILLDSLFVYELEWWVIGFVTGICYVGIFVVAESCLNERTGQQTREQVLVLY